MIAVNCEGRSGKVSIWRVDTAEQVVEFDEATSEFWPCNIAWAPTAPILATLGDRDRAIRLWRLTEAAHSAITPNAANITITPNAANIGGGQRLRFGTALFDIIISFDELIFKVTIENLTTVSFDLEVVFSAKNGLLEFGEPVRSNRWSFRLASLMTGRSRELTVRLYKRNDRSGVELITCDSVRYRLSGTSKWSDWKVPTETDTISIQLY